MAIILITEALSSKAHQLKNKLSVKGNTIMGDFNDVPAVMVSSGAIKKLPHPSASAYPHQILTFCLDNSVNTVYLLNTHEFNALQPAMQLFSEYGIDIQLFNNDL